MTAREVSEGGARPAGVEPGDEAARWVRGMFGRVAPRYDLLNHLLSFSMDRHWRARTALRVRQILQRPGPRALDLCCGTGDLLFALERNTSGIVIGADFCHPMLVGAQRKLERKGGRSLLVEADGLRLPFPDESFDVVTIAFGLRNFASYRQGLSELLRVLRPSGAAAVLEFSQPPNPIFASVYSFYSRRILPIVGGAISGSRDAYTYLPDSVRQFPGAESLAAEMRRSGFSTVEFERMTGGIVALHIATR